MLPVDMNISCEYWLSPKAIMLVELLLQNNLDYAKLSVLMATLFNSGKP
jgi:hypothetical protein